MKGFVCLADQSFDIPDPNVPLHEHHVASVILRVHDGC